MKDIEQSLLEAARKCGLSLAELSRRAELPYATVHGFIVDEKHITLKSAAAIARVLGLQLVPSKAKKHGRSAEANRG